MLLQAQVQVRFPDDISAELVGQEVEIINPLVVTSTNNIEKYGGVFLSSERLWIPTEKNLPGRDMFKEVSAANAANVLLLRGAVGDYVTDGTCRTGQTVTNITGKLTFESNRYNLTPTSVPVFAGNERPTTVDDMNPEPHNLRVVSYNVQQYGNTANLLTMQRDKVTAALVAMNADIYVMIEVKNDGALQDLCTALNAAMGDRREFAMIKNNAGGNSMVSFLYDKDLVTPHGDLKRNELVPSSATNQSPYLRERKVAQAFDLVGTDERLIISGNHWKSKSGTNTGQEDINDGQGSHNPRRLQEAQATIDFLNQMTTYYNDPDVLIVGDLNAYSLEDPIRLLTDAGFVNELQRFSPMEYSYSYNGEVGYLDHALASPSLSEQVVCSWPFHINADEPSYLKISTSLAEAERKHMFKSSDHDPIVTTFWLDSQTGIAPEAQLSGVSLYGDPRQGYVTLRGEQITGVALMDVSGRLLSRYAVSGVPYFVLPLQGLPAGFYIVKVENRGVVSTCKIAIP